MSQRPHSSNRPPSPAGSVATSAGGDIRRKKTQMVDDITEEFQRLGIGIGDPHLEEKISPGTMGEPIKVVSNVYGIKMATMPVFRYDITLSAIFRGGRDKKLEFTKRSKDDSVVVDRKNMCRIAFEQMIGKFPEVFGENPHAVYYDLQCILYTLRRVELGPKNEQVFELDQADCQNVQELQRFGALRCWCAKCVMDLS
uniref:Uncharacterized protein n=1 Tax=Ditylenchus dipsaci TaxID=166011 RepID=A0A915E0E9_9BILA